MGASFGGSFGPFSAGLSIGPGGISGGFGFGAGSGSGNLFPVQIGQFTAQGFAVPPALNFGGAQRLGVHQLPAGARVIDSMGPDESDIKWEGMFITGLGSDNPVQDAQQLDSYRVQGQPLTLSWDVFQYTVIVEHFAADEQYPSKVPFSISFKVVQNLNNPSAPGASAGASAGQQSPAGGGGDIDTLTQGDMTGTLNGAQAAGMTVPSTAPGPFSTTAGAAAPTSNSITPPAQNPFNFANLQSAGVIPPNAVQSFPNQNAAVQNTLTTGNSSYFTNPGGNLSLVTPSP